MRKLTIFSGLSFGLLSIAVMASPSVFAGASADYNADAISRPMFCRGPGLSVEINADRTQFTVHQGVEKVYNVIDSNSDESGVSYTGQFQFAHFPDRAVLTFSDHGDRLEMGGRVIPLRCSS